MDVIGNNIANVNTVAFKSTSVNFNDIMYQTTQAASGASSTTNTGGINAKQIGLGAQMASTKISITSAGASQSTGDAMDCKITGDAFFIVSDGTSTHFTRDGSFYIDGAGNLCMTSTGYKVMGWQAYTDEDGVTDIQKGLVSSLQVMSADNLTSDPEATTQAMVSGVLDQNTTALANDGYAMSMSFYDNLGYKYTAKFSLKETGTAGEYTLLLDDILDSNSKSILEATNGYTDTGNNVDPNTLLVANGGDTSAQGILVKYDTNTGAFVTLTNEGGTLATTAADYDITATLELSKLIANDTNGVRRFTDIEIDFSQSKMADNSGMSTLGMDRGATDGVTGLGKALGNMTGLSIDQQGIIWGAYDNGDTIALGQIAVTTFTNASGLESIGNNCYDQTLNSGEFDGIGQDVTADGGKISTGVLEMSNVDLAKEFTEMITTQRGFQANSRVITTSDTLLEELINLKR
jgi:flagellar hook protein FlgE